MRWNPWGESDPQIGDQKEGYRFAWLPTRVEDKIVWLERYGTRFVYKRCSTFCAWVEYCEWSESQHKYIYPLRRLTDYYG